MVGGPACPGGGADVVEDEKLKDGTFGQRFIEGFLLDLAIVES